MPERRASARLASSTRVPPRTAPNAYMRSRRGRSAPWVARTPITSCAGLATPLATAPASSVRRRGWYHAVPSSPRRPQPEEHGRVATEGRQLAGDIPAVRVAGGEPAEMRLGGDERGGRRGRVEREPVLARVGHPHGRDEARRQEAGLLAVGRLVGCELDRQRPGGVEQPGERRGDAAEREPRGAGAEVGQRGPHLAGGERRLAAGAVDEDEAVEPGGARPPAEVPGGVRGRD